MWARLKTCSSKAFPGGKSKGSRGKLTNLEILLSQRYSKRLAKLITL
jgi:hypothetical protein